MKQRHVSHGRSKSPQPCSPNECHEGCNVQQALAEAWVWEHVDDGRQANVDANCRCLPCRVAEHLPKKKKKKKKKKRKQETTNNHKMGFKHI